jgi:hypothetical protein
MHAQIVMPPPECRARQYIQSGVLHKWLAPGPPGAAAVGQSPAKTRRMHCSGRAAAPASGGALAATRKATAGPAAPLLTPAGTCQPGVPGSLQPGSCWRCAGSRVRADCPLRRPATRHGTVRRLAPLHHIPPCQLQTQQRQRHKRRPRRLVSRQQAQQRQQQRRPRRWPCATAMQRPGPDCQAHPPQYTPSGLLQPLPEPPPHPRAGAGRPISGTGPAQQPAPRARGA